jgi:YVTN family beta-propeller protein
LLQRVILCAAVAALALCGPALAQAPAAPVYKVVGHIPGPDGGWDYANFDAASRRVYLAKGGVVVGMEADTGKVNDKVATGNRTHAAVPLPDDRLLITNGGSDTVTIVSAVDGKVLATIPTGKAPDGAIYDPSSGLAFVSDNAGGEVVFIDVKAQAAVGKVTVGGELEFVAVDARGHVFVNVADKNQIAKIDIKSKTVLARYNISDCDSPSGLAYAPAAGVLIAACDNKIAVVVDAASGKTMGKLPVGSGPDAVIYDPVRKLAFVPAGRDGTLTVISAATHGKVAVVQTLATLSGARTGAVDAKTGKLYLPAAKMGPPAQPGGRPQPLPGGFEFVVVGP